MSKQVIVLRDGSTFTFDSDEASPYENMSTPEGIGLYCGDAGWFSQVDIDRLEMDEIEDISYYSTPQEAYDAAIQIAPYAATERAAEVKIDV